MNSSTDRKLAWVVVALTSLALITVITSLVFGFNSTEFNRRVIMIAFLVAAIPSLIIGLKLHRDWIKKGSPEAINAARRELRDAIAWKLDRAGWRVETDKMLRTSNPLPAQLLLPMVAHSPNGAALLVYPHSDLERDSAHFAWVASAEHGRRALQAMEQIDATSVIVAPAGDRLITDLSQIAGEVDVELVTTPSGTAEEQMDGVLEALSTLSDQAAARQAVQMTIDLPSELADAEKLDF